MRQKPKQGVGPVVGAAAEKDVDTDGLGHLVWVIIQFAGNHFGERWDKSCLPYSCNSRLCMDIFLAFGSVFSSPLAAHLWRIKIRVPIVGGSALEPFSSMNFKFTLYCRTVVDALPFLASTTSKEREEYVAHDCKSLFLQRVVWLRKTCNHQ